MFKKPEQKNKKPTHIVLEHGFTKEVEEISDSSKPYKSRYWLQIILAVLILILDLSSIYYVISDQQAQ